MLPLALFTAVFFFGILTVMKTADAISAVRIIFAPIFFLLYFVPLQTGMFLRVSAYLMLPLLICVEFTDFLDGFYARKQHAVSDFGKLFDPFADVFLHITTFFCCTFSGYMPLWILLFIVYRELGMLFLRLNALRYGITIGAKMGGKAKTVLYIAAGMFSLVLESVRRLGIYDSFLSDIFMRIGFVLYMLCLAASYVSFINYALSFYAGIKNTEKTAK